MPDSVGIVGGGIIGVCCALSLQRAGLRVTLFDRDEPGRACSYGNAGILTGTECGPLGLPGILWRLPKWLIDPLGPMAVDVAHVPRLIPWGLRLLKESRRENVERISDTMRSFYASSPDLYAELLGSVGASDLIRRNGYLCVYANRGRARPDDYFWDLHRRRTIELRELSGPEIRQLAPCVSKGMDYGVHVPGESSVVDPFAVTKALLSAFLTHGGRVERDEVRDVSRDGGASVITLADGERRFGAVVIATGIQATVFARRLGYRVLLTSMRGYHAMLPHPDIDLCLPILSGDHKFYASPMTGGLRLAGTAEFTDYRKRPNLQRADVLVRAANELFSGLNGGDFQRWSGDRPMTPDSLPVVCEAPSHPGIYFAFGHGHNGLSGAPMTARIITALATGGRSPLDIQPFSIARFS
jgi:D-amino-acid dehydrogenase